MAPSGQASKAKDVDEDEDLPFPTLRCDIHTHILPPRLAERIRSYFEASGMVRCCPPLSPPADMAAPSSSTQSPPELMYPTGATPLVAQLFAELATPSSRKPTPSALRKALLRPGKTGPYNGARPLHLVTLPYAHKGDMSIHLNRDVFRLAQSLTRDELWNNRLLVTPGFTVHPEDVSPPPVDVVADALGRGGRVMKLHCSVGQLSVLDERLAEVWRVAEETGFPTVVHFGTSVFGTTEDAELSELETFVERFPKAKIIVGEHRGPNAIATKLSAHPGSAFRSPVDGKGPVAGAAPVHLL